jgi:hypothetical protein
MPPGSAEASKTHVVVAIATVIAVVISSPPAWYAYGQLRQEPDVAA